MNPDDDPIKYLNSVDVSHKFSFKITSEEAMLTCLMMLKGSKAPGSDGVSTNLIKDAEKSIAKPLMMIFNASLAKGIVPDIRKLAKITPVFKSGARIEKIIIGQFRFCLFLQSYLKKLCMTSYRTSSFQIEY